jgi:HNH endonuclease
MVPITRSANEFAWGDRGGVGSGRTPRPRTRARNVDPKIESRSWTRNQRGAWEVEHSVACARGGHTHHLNNLYAACISCNRRKGPFSTRTARGYHGRKSAPLALKAKQRVREDNAVEGALIAGTGAVLLGVAPPVGLAVTVLGALIGHDRQPDPQKGVRRR